MEEMFNNQMQEQQYAYYEPAERGDRFLARLLDSLIYFVIVIAAAIAIGATSTWRYDSTGSSIIIVVVFLFLVLGLVVYQAFLLSTRGQTIGKMAMKIRIVKVNTNSNGGFVTNFLLRFLVNYIIAYVIPFYGLIDTLFIFSEEKRCLHDRIAGTKVIKDIKDIACEPTRVFNDTSEHSESGPYSF